MNKRFTPEIITELAPNEVFVFGSNTRGVHGAGAAKVAVEQFGAVMGKGEGLYGQSYAFPTKNKNIQTLSLGEIRTSVTLLIACCEENKDKTFLLTKVGCGLAGLSIAEVAGLFKEQQPLPKNLVLPEEFDAIING